MALANSGTYENPAEAGQTDAQSQNNIDRNVRQYRDLDLYFRKTSGSNDISRVTDVQAVKRSIRNLVLLNRYEKPFQPQIFGGVLESLFEPMSTLTALFLGKQIEAVIGAYEPRVNLTEVNVIDNIDRNAYEVQIKFTLINTPTELVDLSLMLERIR